MYAFHDCTSLKDITILNAMTKIGECAFKNTAHEKKEVIEIPEGVTKLNDHILTSEVKKLIIPSSLREFGIQDISNLKKIFLPHNYLKDKDMDQFIDAVKTNPSLTISASPQDILLLRGKVDATLEPTISFLEYYKDISVSIQENILIDQQIGGYHIKQYDIGNGEKLYEVEKDDALARSDNLCEAMQDVETILHDRKLDEKYEEGYNRDECEDYER